MASHGRKFECDHRKGCQIQQPQMDLYHNTTTKDEAYIKRIKDTIGITVTSRTVTRKIEVERCDGLKPPDP